MLSFNNVNAYVLCFTEHWLREGPLGSVHVCIDQLGWWPALVDPPDIAEGQVFL